MKKLIISACAIAMAVCAQAGAVKWSATYLSSSPAVTVGEGVTYSAFFFTGSDVSAVTAFLTAATPDLDSFGKAVADSNTASYNVDKEALSFAAKSYGDYKNTDVSGFMIIVDAADIKNAKYFQVAEKDGDQVMTVSFGSTGTKTMAWGDQSENAWTKIGNVPEPTSGLLLLLGVAGLALRRRRA